MIHQAQIV